MKGKRTDIDRMVMESHYLESLERESSSSLSDMERQEYIDRIKSQQETIDRQTDMIKTLQLTLESVSSSNKRNENLIRNLTAQIE